MIHVSTLTLLDELGMERREKRKSTKNVKRQIWKMLISLFGKNGKITKPPRMNVMYSIGVDFHSKVMMKFFNVQPNVYFWTDFNFEIVTFCLSPNFADSKTNIKGERNILAKYTEITLIGA